LKLFASAISTSMFPIIWSLFEAEKFYWRY